MNPERTRQYLELYRQKTDDEDPVMKEALEQAANNPGLKSFLNEESSLNQRIQQSMRSITVPENLKEDILRKCDNVVEERTIVFPWWSKVAAVVMLAGILIFSFIGPDQDTSVQTAGLNILHDLEAYTTRYLKSQEFSKCEFYNVNSVDEIRKYLISHNLPDPQVLKNAVVNAGDYRCASVDYNGRKLSLIRFADKATGTPCHLFVADLSEFPCMSKHSQVQFREYPNASAALWSCSERIYLLIAEVPREQLEIVMR